MSEVIYTMRYHFEKELEDSRKDRIAQKIHAVFHPFRNQAEKKKRQAEIDEIIRQHNEESEYVEIPGAEQQVERFIAVGKQLSEELQLDVDIKRSESGICVAYHIFSGPIFSDYMEMVSELVAMSTSMDIFINKTEPSDVTISLELRTHELYICGRKIGV